MDETSNLAIFETRSLETKKQVQDLETQKEVWVSLLKGLPTVIIVTVVAVVTSLIYVGNSGSHIAVSASVMTFIGTSALWICALIFTTSADKRIVKLRGESETLKREEDRLRSEAREMFVRYKSTVMTNPVITPNYGNLDVDNFTINPGSVTDWRSTLTPGRQADMEHLNSILVREMDQLRDLSKEFVVRFNQYVQATRDDVNELPMRGLEEYVQKDTERMLIFAIYAYH